MMKIKNIMLGLLACGTFGFMSCSDDDFTEFKSALTVTSAETSIEAAGGTKQIHVDGPLASVYASASWLTIAQSGSVVNVTASVNPDVQSRNAIVVLKASESDSTIVNISQFGARFEVNVPEQITVLAHGKSEATFDILHNIPVYTTPSADWISAVVTDDAITIYTEPNAAGGDREGYIDVETGAVSQRIEIIQYDICGRYDLTGTDRTGKPVTLSGVLSGGETGKELNFKLDKYADISIPLIFNAETKSISLYAANFCGMNNNLYTYTLLVNFSSRSLCTNPEVSMSGLLIKDNENVKFLLADNGSWGMYVADGFFINSFTTENPESIARGTLENVFSPTFIKVN